MGDILAVQETAQAEGRRVDGDRETWRHDDAETGRGVIEKVALLLITAVDSSAVEQLRWWWVVS